MNFNSVLFVINADKENTMNVELILYIIKFVLVGFVTFLSILNMSKTRAASWMFIMCGFIFMYISLLYDLFLKLGIMSEPNLYIYGIPLVSLLFIVIPCLFFSIGFIVRLSKK